MEFMPSRPDIVRADHQRWLLAHWTALRGASPLPAWQRLQLEALAVPADNLSVLAVAATNGSTRFQIKFHGEAIARLTGLVSVVGQFLDDILPPSSREAKLASYRQAVRRGCRSTPSRTCVTRPAASSTMNGCCCPSAAATEQPSSTSWPRSKA